MQKNSQETNIENLTLISQHLVMQEHLNPRGSIFGGQLLAWLDVDAYIHVANTYQYKNFVTSSLQEVFFRNPGYAGDIIQVYASIEKKEYTRVMVKAVAVAFDSVKQISKTILECFITYVALDGKNKITRIPSEKKHIDA